MTSPVVCGLEGVDNAMKEAYLVNYKAFRVGITQGDMLQTYNAMAYNGQYEQHLGRNTYRGPTIAAEFVHKYVTDPDAPVMDVAAGSGFVGEELNKLGFTNLDGLEPSSGMRKLAEEKNLYNRMYSDLLGDEPTDIQTGYYDACVCSGGFGEGHIPCSGLKEMCRVTKKGGFVIIVMREEYLHYVKEYVDRLESYMEQMEKDGIWKKLEKTVIQEYAFHKPGVVFVFQKN